MYMGCGSDRLGAALLAALGLDGPICAAIAPLPKNKPKRAADVQAAKRRRKDQTPKAPCRPTRSSRRLQNQELELEEVAAAGGEGDDSEDNEEDNAPIIDYTEMPVEPVHLDDFEFEVYVALRAWRWALSSTPHDMTERSL